MKCTNCGTNVEFEIREEMKPIIDEDGKKVGEYTHKEAYCPKCSHFNYIDEIQVQNIENKNDAIRQIAGIIGLSDIKKLPRKYGIPREYLMRVLSVKTPVWDGEVPTSAESERMEKALMDKGYFKERLEQKKDEIPAEIYERVIGRLK